MAKETADEIAVRFFYDIGYDADEITRRLLTELRIRRDAADLLFPWVKDRVNHVCRRETLRQARQLPDGVTAGGSLARTRGELEAINGRDFTSRRPPPLAFLDCWVALPRYPEGGKLYRDFTVADHEWRIRIHRRNIVPAERSIEGHMWAQQTIRQHEVATLGEIDPEELMQELPPAGVRP